MDQCSCLASFLRKKVYLKSDLQQNKGNCVRLSGMHSTPFGLSQPPQNACDRARAKFSSYKVPQGKTATVRQCRPVKL